MARGAFWTIIVDDQPTAFRAPVREDLLPTLKQLQRQHPNAVIKWFQRGRLWETPGEAMDANKPPRRGPGWRPGGEHKDPREQYKVPRDVKRARWASQAAEGRGPWMKDRPQGDRPPRPPRDDRAAGSGDTRPERPRADRPRDDRPRSDGPRPFAPRGDRPSGERPAWRPKPEGDRGAGSDRPRGPRADGGKPAWRPKPGGDRGASAERPAWKPKGDRPAGDRPAWRPKPGEDRAPREPQADKTGWKPAPGSRPATGKREPTTGNRAPGTRPDWRDRGERRDVTPRSGGDAPKPAAKKARTWRVGELPPADRKRKKNEE
jgi:hypothetical protein